MRQSGTALPRNVLALHAFIDSRASVPHAWGRRANDCAGYSLDAVQALTGVDRAPELDWTDAKSGVRVIAAEGGLEAAYDRRFQRIAPALAQRGDIAGVPDADFGIHPMIVEGGTLVGPGEVGNRRQPRAAMTIAWSAVLPPPEEASDE